MARIPYAEENLDPEMVALADQIRAERDGQIPNIYRMLLNNPAVARGWLNLLTAVRFSCKLAGRYREMVIMRIAVINGADYEYRAHAGLALKEGLTARQVEALSDWQESTEFGDADRAVLAYTDAMTKAVHVPDSVFEPLRKHFDQREITELTATIAAFNLVSRFLEALQIDHEKH
ncbi:MAG: carboxymuconolactone decarboxylase family protein [Burkholderiales bacterium]|nr:carboxymuconolactone decarboxylase family protein [Burkholderiales bacterium]